MKRILLTLAALAAANVANAESTTNYYTTLSAFNSAATTATTYGFNGIAAGNSSVTNPAVLVTPQAGRVTFSVIGGTDQNVYAIGNNFAAGAYSLSDGSDTVAAGVPNGSQSTTTIALGGSYTAFAIEYGMTNNASENYTINLMNGVFSVGSTGIGTIGGDNFFGATSSVTFDSVSFQPNTASTNYLVFDNARVGSRGAAVVPEAGTLALLLPALGMVSAMIVRRRAH